MSSNPVMGAPKRGAEIIAALKKEAPVINDAPKPIEARAPAPVEQERASLQTVPPAPPVAFDTPRGMSLDQIRAMKPRKESREQANARYPTSLLDDIDLICRLTGMKKNDILVEGARKEVAILKKRYGLD